MACYGCVCLPMGLCLRWHTGVAILCVSLQGRAGRRNARDEVHAWRYTQDPVGESGDRGRRGVYEACSVKWAEEATCAARGCWGSIEQKTRLTTQWQNQAMKNQ